jgi:C4-dicarboxylate-specific signal transduction histidine kinase
MQRYAGRSIQFQSEGNGRGLRLPAELFDRVADNLIENAFNKDPAGPGVQVRVTLTAERGGALTVCDTGPAIAQDVASQLFEAPVPSQTGLGIGLYHSARQAAQLGYRLALVANRAGSVCFTLMRGDERSSKA